MAPVTLVRKQLVNLLLVSSWLPLIVLASQHNLNHHHPRVPINVLRTETSLPTPEPISLPAVSVNGGLVPRELLPRADTGGQTSSSSASNDYTCGPNKPCGNGACCGASGWCGYEPKYCGAGCQSNCDAKAECGAYAATPGKTCPLNVCCSEFGFCGTTSEFCASGCQSNCDQPKPSVAKTNTQKKIVAYWEGWNENKACGQMQPSEIPVNDISHLIFAFGFITPGPDFKITNMDDVRPELFREVAFLKDKNPDLTVMIALGGWTFNDPGKWQPVFGDMVSSAQNRKKFISNLLGFLSQYGFDGVDFDWEYPGADDRGGHAEDGVNYTQFLKELRDAIKSSGRDYVVTYTAPTSYWYLRHFDLENMHQYVDWINLMSYDLHGIWDSNNPIGNQILGHTNLTEIDLALDLFWRNNIPPGDIVLGMGFYGRSFKLQDSKCWKPGCAFTGPGDKGDCTNTAGFLSYAEIMDIVASTNAKPVYDKEAKVNYLVYGQNNWISYDDKRTFQDKIDYANNMGLNGLMMWAIDLDDPKRTALSALTGNAIDDELDPIAATEGGTTVGHSSSDSSQCRVTDCGGFCNQAETAVGRVKSYFGDHGCSGDSSNARYVCCPAWTSLTPDDCHWNAGGGAVRTDCSGKCDIGEIKLFSDSDGWKGDLKTGSYDYHCLRGKKVFCCKAGNMQQYLDICTWTKCGESCPSDKQNVLTTDSGGPRDEGNRCDGYKDGDVFTNPSGQSDDWKDPTKGTKNHRKLCCPKADSFKNCGWKNSKVCSEQCGQGQITLDLDPQGQGGYYCDNGRQQAFCCDPPGGKDQPFLPVSLENLFPPEYLPPADAVPQFELTGFNGRAEIGLANPDQTGVAFFLMAGSDTLVSSARKRDDGRGLHFLDCPTHILDQPNDRVQTARVICLDSPEEECLAMTKGGVEGTVVQMPHDCGNSSFARAVSLVPSQDQSVPVALLTDGPSPSSAVFDFSFDYDMPLVRRDAGVMSIRMDYSNVNGYWDSLVDSPGKKKKRDYPSLHDLVDRFYSSSNLDWATKFNALDFDGSASLSDLSKSDIGHLVFFETEMCTTDEGQNGEGIAVAIDGELDVDLFYGFSLIATWDPSSTVKVHQAAGFLHATGTTSAKYTVAGIGTLDVSQKLNGASITKTSGQKSIGGHALFHGWASFVPYKEEGVRLSSSAGLSAGAVSFNGHMEVSAKAGWGDLNNHFPTGSVSKAPDLVVSKSNNITPLGQDTTGSSISVANTVKLGLKVDLAFSKPYQSAVDGELPDMSITQTLVGRFELEGTSSEICLKTQVIQEHKQTLTSGSYVGWPATSDSQYMTGASEVGTKECFTGSSSSATKKKTKRQNNSVPGDFSGLEGIPDLTYLINSDARGGATVPEISCNGCGSCVLSTDPDNNICCECAWLPPEENYLVGIEMPSATSKRSLTDGYGRSSFEDDVLAQVHARLADSSLALDTDEDELISELYDNVLAALGAKPGTSPVERTSILKEPLSTADDEILQELLRRATRIGEGRKDITFWDPSITGDQRPIVVETELYPQYPDYAYNPTTDADWDGSVYTGVKKYFHNSTAVCTSFDVAQAATADVMYPWPEVGRRNFKYKRGTAYHQLYQTEHVFEPQTLARFFTKWMPESAATPRQRFWSETYILTPNSRWGDGVAFVHILADEVGTLDHEERLTIFMTRPNGIKGSLFGGRVSITQARFGEYAAGAKQLLNARQTGMVFSYMNIDTVWESYCDAYNGILDRLEEFDTWYTGQTGVNPDLAGEWPRFIRSELDMVVTRARADLKLMNQVRKNAGVAYRALWQTIMAVNGGEIQKVKLERTDKCRNLPASTVGPFTG